MAFQGKKRTLSETSSSDEESNLQAFDDRMLKKHKNSSSDRTCNGNVASDQEYRLDYQSMSSMGQMMGSSSQDSEPSDNEDSQPSIHKTYIKSKPVYDPVIDQKAKAMMAKMGWAKGTGLGKKSQGMVQPIEVSKQRGRRGLGLQIKGLEAEEVEWDSSEETIIVEEAVLWCSSNDSLHPPSQNEMESWLIEGTKKNTIDDETEFCKSEILKQVLQCKSIFDKLEEEELRKARSRSNPFETIRGAFFLNRAAMKMANIDAVFEFMFTEPKSEEGAALIKRNELLYFADVCAGPGGFSEYVLWRKKWEAKGFGFTLKKSNDFKLEDFYAAPCECFEPHYGVHGIEGDGDVYNPNNIAQFRHFVISQTEGKGVHFMMADGGFSVEGQENIQEILSKRLYLCQFLVALGIVRTGGHFVCKLFDVFTPFSIGLIYLMYRTFKQICIHKPNTSRPANSERYIICKWKRDDTQDVEQYLHRVNYRLEELSRLGCKNDVTHIVPLELIKANQEFYNYIFDSNNILGKRQVVNLAKIAAYCKDVTLREDRQSELKKQSLEFWKIPDRARTAPPRANPTDRAKELLINKYTLLDKKADPLRDYDMLRETVKSIYDWRFVVLGLEGDKPMQSFFLGLGRNNVFYWDASKSRWQKLIENLELVRDTLIYGELIQELRGEGRSQKRSWALHVIDAIFLGGVDVSHFHLKDRYEKVQQYCKALNKTSRTDLVTVRAKEHFRLEDLNLAFDRLVPRIIKNSGCQERLVFSLDNSDQRAFLPCGLLLYKATKSPWMIALSKSSGRKYWYHVMNRSSVYDCPKDSIADSYECHSSRIVWWLNSGHPPSRQINQDFITKERFMSFICEMSGRQ